MPRYRTCGKPAKVQRDGDHFCGVHDPLRLAALREANAPKRAATEARRRAMWLHHFSKVKAARNEGVAFNQIRVTVTDRFFFSATDGGSFAVEKLPDGWLKVFRVVEGNLGSPELFAPHPAMFRSSADYLLHTLEQRGNKFRRSESDQLRAYLAK